MEDHNATSPAPTPVKCPNCRYAIIANLPTKCSECGYPVVSHDPLWKDRPLGWRLRLLMIGWPLAGIAAGFPFLNASGAIGQIATVVFVGHFLVAFINAPVMFIASARRPPAYIEGESPERAAKRREITALLTVGFGVLIPVLLFGSCLYSFTPPF